MWQVAQRPVSSFSRGLTDRGGLRALRHAGSRVPMEKRYDGLYSGPWTNPKRRVIGHFPQMTVGIFEVSAISSPVCFCRFLCDQHTLAFEGFKKVVHLVLGLQIMSEGYPVETRAVVWNAESDHADARFHAKVYQFTPRSRRVRIRPQYQRNWYVHWAHQETGTVVRSPGTLRFLKKNLTFI